MKIGYGYPHTETVQRPTTETELSGCMQADVIASSRPASKWHAAQDKKYNNFKQSKLFMICVHLMSQPWRRKKRKKLLITKANQVPTRASKPTLKKAKVSKHRLSMYNDIRCKKENTEHCESTDTGLCFSQYVALSAETSLGNLAEDTSWPENVNK